MTSHFTTLLNNCAQWRHWLLLHRDMQMSTSEIIRLKNCAAMKTREMQFAAQACLDVLTEMTCFWSLMYTVTTGRKTLQKCVIHFSSLLICLCYEIAIIFTRFDIFFPRSFPETVSLSYIKRRMFLLGIPKISVIFLPSQKGFNAKRSKQKATRNN